MPSTLNPADPHTLTLREAFELHYRPHADLSPASLSKYEVALGHWEAKTGNPELAAVDNATVADFRRQMIEAEFSPCTINSCWGQLRAIFRHLGPQEFKNPFGLGILERIPAMKRVREIRDTPYRIPLDDLDRTYRAAGSAAWPRSGIPAPDLWRTLLVLAYTTGLRRDDLKSLQWDSIDLQRETIQIRAGKTGKADVRKLHPAAVAHLHRIFRQTKEVFYGLNSNNGRLYSALRQIQRAGQVSRRFTLHDIRRTGASEIERVAKGVGRVYLQHAPTNISDISYLSRIDELNEALLDMRMPPAFVGEIPHEDLAPIAPHDRDEIATADYPILNRGEWDFRPGAFKLCGRWFSLPCGVSLSILKAFAFASRPLSVEDVALTLNRPDISRSRISSRVSNLREDLCIQLGIKPPLDPLPLVQTRPAAWGLYLPAYVLDRIRARNGQPAGDAGSRIASASPSLPFLGEVA